jgi:hypothetical protein
MKCGSRPRNCKHCVILESRGVRQEAVVRISRFKPLLAYQKCQSPNEYLGSGSRLHDIWYARRPLRFITLLLLLVDRPAPTLYVRETQSAL